MTVHWLEADELPRCQHCPNLADERSFMCEDCSGQADEEADTLREQLQGAVKTLERIREHAGAVCATYEACEHPACQASYAAWTLADEYLQRGQSGDVRCTDCGTTRAQAVIDCPGCDVPRGHAHRSSEPNTEETR